MKELLGENDVFYLTFQEDFFEVGEICNTSRGFEYGYNVKVLKLFKPKWYQKLLNKISFGLYELKYKYEVKLVEDE